LIDPAVDRPQPFPAWLSGDLKSKLKYIGKFPKTVFKLGGIYLYECPLSWITKDTKRIMEYLFIEETPTRIYPGQWPDQPKWWLEAIQIYKHEKLNKVKDG